MDDDDGMRALFGDDDLEDEALDAGGDGGGQIDAGSGGAGAPSALRDYGGAMDDDEDEGPLLECVAMHIAPISALSHPVPQRR